MNAFKDARVLTEASLAIALAFVLGFVTLFRMPLGGSISFEMVPLILLAVGQGWKVGMLAGAAYGLLNLAISPVILHPIQVLLRALTQARPSRREQEFGTVGSEKTA